MPRLTIHHEKPQPLGTGQSSFGNFIQAGEIFYAPAIPAEFPMSPAGRAIDEKYPGRFCHGDQYVAPFEIHMAESFLVDGAGMARNLSTDFRHPLTIA